jgi:hypothetical protein
MRRLMSSSRIACAVLALATVFARGPSAGAVLEHLHGIDDIRGWFNAGKGHVRLILLLSPT